MNFQEEQRKKLSNSLLPYSPNNPIEHMLPPQTITHASQKDKDS